MSGRWWTWGGFASIWLVGAILWSLAVTDASGATVLEALPVGVLQMTVAGTLSLGVWRLTALVRWPARSWTFLLAHGAAIAVFATAFTAAQGIALPRGRPVLEAMGWALTTPVAGWNLLMAGIIYLAVAGVCYAQRVEASLRESERARAEARLTARDAQLAALSAQLQPHFLFNALHTVSSLVHDDPERADRALDELGRLLMYALRDHADEVTLRQEWSFARDYLAFEGRRLGRRLRLHADIDERALSATVPPFVLQPLVENAVRHGAGAPTGNVDLAVEVARLDGTVRIVIRNSVPAGGEKAPGMAGSGLRRLRERLALSYGPGRAAVEAVETPGTFRVTVTIPADPDGAP